MAKPKCPKAKCALCGEVAHLRRSHIIPELLFKRIYDEAPRRFFEVSSDADKRPVIHQQGFRECLLCERCEQKISKWESYADLLLERQAATRSRPYGMDVLGVNYNQFKLFQISILWKAAVSHLPAFRYITLTPSERRQLRNMIRSENPGAPHLFGCWMIANSKHADQLIKSLTVPRQSKHNGIKAFIFQIGPIFYNFIITNDYGDFIERNVFLNKDGVLPIFVENDHTSRYIIDFWSKISASGNLERIPSSEKGFNPPSRTL